MGVGNQGDFMNNIVYAIFADSDPETYVYKITASKEEADRYVRNGFIYREMFVTQEEKQKYMAK